MSEGKGSGKVKCFDLTKGYGFITPDDGNKDLFVHQTSIHSNGFRLLAEGEAVKDTVEHENGGRTKALDVTGPDGAFVQDNSGGGHSGGRGGGRGVRFSVNCSKEVATAMHRAIFLANYFVNPVMRGYYGNKIKKPHIIPFKVTGNCGWNCQNGDRPQRCWDRGYPRA